MNRLSTAAFAVIIAAGLSSVTHARHSQAQPLKPLPATQVPATQFAATQSAAPPAWTSAPYAGRHNHANSTPQFRWGWFGAERFAPPVKYHRGYYREIYRWNRK